MIYISLNMKVRVILIRCYSSFNFLKGFSKNRQI